MREAASRGFWVGSRTPYGYNRLMVQDGAKKRPTLEPNPDTSLVVKRIFDMAEAGTGMLYIAKALNREGIPSPAGKLWSKNTIHFVLRNEVYTGTLIWGASGKSKDEPVVVEKAFPAIVSKTRFQRIHRLMRTRGPRITNPRRIASSYLLSGLVKCEACNRALSGQNAKSGRFAYYVCQSIMKHGKDACTTPRLSARRFEKLVVDKIRSNVLTDSNIRSLVRVVNDQMDDVASEQRKKLEAIEDQLEDVKRKLGRIWHFIESTDNFDMAHAADQIREHRETQEHLEDQAADARAILSERKAVLDDADTVATHAQDMSDYLKESELTERKAFIETFVKEIVVTPGNALLRYTIPMPVDSRVPGEKSEDMALPGSVLSSLKNGGAYLYGRQNRVVKRHILGDSAGQKPVVRHGHGVANQGVPGDDHDLLNEALNEGPALGELTPLQEVLHVSGVGRDGVHVVQVCPALGEDGPGVRRSILRALLSLPVLLDPVRGVGYVDVGCLDGVPDGPEPPLDVLKLIVGSWAASCPRPSATPCAGRSPGDELSPTTKGRTRAGTASASAGSRRGVGSLFGCSACAASASSRSFKVAALSTGNPGCVTSARNAAAPRSDHREPAHIPGRTEGITPSRGSG